MKFRSSIRAIFVRSLFLVLPWQANSSPDIVKPVVTITSPSAASVRVLSNSVTLAGRVKEDSGLLGVFVRAPDEAPTQVSTTNDWSMTFPLVPGTNLFQIFAEDLAGNFSLTNTRSVFYVVSNLFTLSTTGSGSVTPNLSNQLLEVGRNYTLIAKPGAGHVFSNWTGGLISLANPLAFAMESNLVLQANFVPNPFADRRGSYNGLFYELAELHPDLAGFFNVAVTDRGRFSASATIGGKRYAWSGHFNAGGFATNKLLRAGTNALTIDLQLKLDQSGMIIGHITDERCVADLWADRAPVYSGTNASPHIGKYTFRVAHDTNAPGVLPGDSIGAISVEKRGAATVTATLADGTTATQRVPLSASGALPLHLALYKGRGLALGWLYLDSENDGTDALAGLIDWIRPVGAAMGLFASGFTNQGSANGSRYVLLAGTRVLDFTDGVVSFASGSEALFGNDVVLNANNRITNLDTNQLTLTLKTASGLYSGTAVEPDTGRKLQFKGAVFQGGNYGAGWFLSTNQSGTTRFE